MAVLVLFLMLFSAVPIFVPGASPDPGVVDNGDFTKSVLWNFTDASDYVLLNASISGGMGRLSLVNETVVENSTAQYLLGTASNIDFNISPDAMAIDDTSLTVHTLVLQPGPEAIDCYLDEWFPGWNPDGLDLELSPEYDPNPASSERCRIVMKLDLSAVPPGATISKATLLLYEKSSKGGTIYYSIHALNRSFNEQAVSWREPWENDGGDFSTESFSNGTVDGTNGWHSFDLTRLVDLWTRGAVPNYGFIIVARDETFDGTKSFTSSDISNKPEQRPQLVVNYTMEETSGTYESRALGPGTNATFTLASWTEGIISMATDEFEAGAVSSRLNWTNDPTLAGGSVNFDRPGWLNITGSQPTDLTNVSAGPNYLHHAVDGNFRAEAGLQKYFSANGMGAGLLMRSDDITWLAIYATGVQGSGSLVAKVCKGGVTNTLGSLPWASANAFLRIDRVNGTYQLSGSSDGQTWTAIATYTPQYDFPLRTVVGLCVFSGGLPQSPVVEFDFLRVMPVGQNPAIEIRLRTGNSTDMGDPSWQPWGAPLWPDTGTVIGRTGMYMQYRVTMGTNWDWLSPLFSGISCHEEHYLPDGVITTFSVYPNDLSAWESMTVTQSTSGGSIVFYYSTDLGDNWQLLGSGDSFAMAVSEPSMMLRMVLETHDTIATPTIDTIELVYSLSVVSFDVSAPASVQAGSEFQITIVAKDPSGNVATQWNGTVTLHAMDASGASYASSELNVTSAVIPVGGTVTITNQRYDSAEIIRIGVSMGSVFSMSSQINVVAGPAVTLTLEPGNTTMYDYTSETFTASALDACGNIITASLYAWTADPSLGTLNATSGRVVQLTVGERYTGGFLTVTCSGLNVSRWIDVIPMRFPPTIASPLPGQNQSEDFGEWTLDISGYVSDLEDPVSSLRWYATNESLVSVRGENKTGNFLITLTTLPNAFGSNDLDIFVVDSDGMSAKAVLSIEITPVNDPPVLKQIEPFSVEHDVPYVYDFMHYIHDPDNPYSELTLSVDIASAAYATISGQAIIFTFPETMLGTTQTVIVTVTDKQGASAATAVLVKVLDNKVPVRTNSFPIIALDQGTTLADCLYLPSFFSDPEGDELGYEWECEHSTLLIKLDGHVNVTAPDDWYGTEYAIIQAIDPYGARAEGVVQIVVRHVNHPCSIKGVPDLKVRYDVRYLFDVQPYVEDKDEGSEVLVFVTNDLHCTFSGSVLSVLYPMSMNGTVNPVTITVLDDEYTSSDSIYITVSDNYPPEQYPGRPAPDHTFQEDSPTRYPMEQGLEHYFLDVEDGQALRFEAFSLNSNISTTVFMNETGVWKTQFNVTQDYYGSSDLVIRAIDSSGAIAEQTITVLVTPVPDAPVLTLPGTFSVIEGQKALLNLAEHLFDPDSSMKEGDITFAVQIIGMSGNADEYLERISALSGMIVFDFPEGFLADHNATFTIEIAATDETGRVGKDQMLISLHEAPSVGKENPLMLTAAVLAAAGGASGMAVIAYVRRKKPFVIRDMMLVHNDGFLIGRLAEHPHAEGEIDQDILSGMLTAVLNFVEDSMMTSHESLKTFGFKDYQVLVRRGTKVYAAIVHEGDLPNDIEKPIVEFLGTFERVYRKKIVNWTGDIETDFAGVELLIQSFVKEHSKKRKGKAKKPLPPEPEKGEVAAK